MYAYFLGLYLGDGSIARHRHSVFKLRITLDAKYPAIIVEAARAMREVLPKSKVNLLPRVGDVEIYSFFKVVALPLFPSTAAVRSTTARSC